MGKKNCGKNVLERMSFLRRSSNIHRESGNYLGFGDDRENSTLKFNCKLLEPSKENALKNLNILIIHSF
ncbi:hypothetical protein MSBRW_0128 [Methanosarcina barkeri str. Wiesmoor]|uniref:Uncharacterized protein n=1 Tax=Methanosarcina barkeri str. Wiesmoor TaxID=1434109 RepID=A0A0E3LKE5_METBA|nr:hypothetical protein MSBRW_0128 [Methanosarcina barkeri str. Wiesmoor]